jgi:hypothetical protein
LTPLLTVLALVAGAGVGVAVRFSAPPEAGGDLVKILNATSLVAGLLAAFVLSGANGSYIDARSAIKQEADAVAELYDSADYVPRPYSHELQAADVCYARAVMGPEWRAMASSETSDVPDNWAGYEPGGIHATIVAFTRQTRVFDNLDLAGLNALDAAKKSQDALRAERLTQAKPTVAPVLYWLTVLLLAVSLASITHSVSRKKPWAHLAALVFVTGLFCCIMLLILDLDRPFSGLVRLEPTAMTQVEQEESARYVATYDRQPPCDANGNPSPAILALRKA